MAIEFTVDHDHTWAGGEDGFEPLIGWITFAVTTYPGDFRVREQGGGVARTINLPPRKAWLAADGHLYKDQTLSLPCRLVANDPAFNLDHLTYRADFELTTMTGEPVTVPHCFFPAPSTDTTLQLTKVMDDSAQTVMEVRAKVYLEDILDLKTGVGEFIGDIVEEMAPGLIADVLSADLATRDIGFIEVGDTAIQFVIGGEPFGEPLQIPSGTWSGTVGKPAVIGAGATGLEARANIGAPLYIDVAASPYNVTPETVSPEIKIQEAIDFAAANDIPEVIISKPGTYTVGLHVIPGQTSTAAALWGYSNVKLTMRPGVIIKLRDNATRPDGATQGHIISVISPFPPGTLTGAKNGWNIEGGVIDGNSANQSSVIVSVGVFLGSCQASTIREVMVKNIWGNDNVPPGESVGFTANNCRDVRFIGCEVDGGGPNSATGFSADNSFGIAWTSCVAHDLGRSCGFTAWQCSGLRYSDCHAYRVGANGFNLERSNDVVYSSCVSGGRSPFIGLGPYQNPWFPDGQTQLGNAGTGFAIKGSEDVALAACVATYNNYGLRVYSDVMEPKKPCKRVIATGCVFRYSTAATNTYVESAPSGLDQLDVQIIDCIAAGINDDDVRFNYSNSPVIKYETKAGASGVRYWTTGDGGYAYRWLYGAATGPLSAGSVMTITTRGQLQTAGRRFMYRQTATDTTIVPTDEVIGVTNTSTLRKIQLPPIANVGTGATFLIKDETGAAATNKIHVIGYGVDDAGIPDELIDGVDRKIIDANYGHLRVMATATGWTVLTFDEAARIATGAVPAGTTGETIGTTGKIAVLSNANSGLSNGSQVFVPQLNNALAYLMLRGGAVTATKNGVAATGADFHSAANAFLPNSSQMVLNLTASTDVFVIEVDHTSVPLAGPAMLSYGIEMRQTQSAKNITIEVWDATTSAWVSIGSCTNNLSGAFASLAPWSASNQRTKIRYTLTNFVSASACYIRTMFAFDSNNSGSSDYLLPRGGGNLYGTAAAPPKLTAPAGVDLLLEAGGAVKANGNPVGVKVALPASATAAGKPGQWAADNAYVYWYTGDGTTHRWVRSAVATW